MHTVCTKVKRFNEIKVWKVRKQNQTKKEFRAKNRLIFQEHKPRSIYNLNKVIAVLVFNKHHILNKLSMPFLCLCPVFFIHNLLTYTYIQ